MSYSYDLSGGDSAAPMSFGNVASDDTTIGSSTSGTVATDAVTPVAQPAAAPATVNTDQI